MNLKEHNLVELVSDTCIICFKHECICIPCVDA